MVLVNTDRAGASFPLSASGLKFGKAPDNDVVIDHPTVSRNHLEVVKQGDRFLVKDLGSTNGTFLDGAQIREAYLKPGALVEMGDVKLRFQSEVAPVTIAPQAEDRLGDLVGKSVPMRQIFALLQRIGPTDSTLLLVGETGAGKGAAAKAIHQLSPRSSGPLVVFDCASVSDTLIESELFGHEKGAFTGAIAPRIGCLERAQGGTLFLDEIDDLSLDLQPKLLRAIEDREFRRLGTSSAPVSFDARIIVASKKDLWSETQAGRFREDLYFRLSVFTVTLPPLRDRQEDIPLLVNAFAGEPLWEQLPEPMREQFLAHTWPGNVRELRNALERARHVAELPELSGESVLREFTRSVSPAEGETLPVRYEGPFKERKDELIRGLRAGVPGTAAGPDARERGQGVTRGRAGPEAPLLAAAQVPLGPRQRRSRVGRRPILSLRATSSLVAPSKYKPVRLSRSSLRAPLSLRSLPPPAAVLGEWGKLRPGVRKNRIEASVQGGVGEVAVEVAARAEAIASLEEHVEAAARGLTGGAAGIQVELTAHHRSQRALGLAARHVRDRGPVVIRGVRALQRDVATGLERHTDERDRDLRDQIHVRAIVVEVGDLDRLRVHQHLGVGDGEREEIRDAAAQRVGAAARAERQEGDEQEALHCSTATLTSPLSMAR